MATYIDLRLPDDIEKGSQGGLAGLTSVSVTTGRRQAVDHRPVPMGRWDIAYGLRELPEHVHQVQAIHAFCRRVHAFGFRDLLDYQVPNYWDETGAFQVLGAGDGSSAVFQAIKTFEPFAGLTLDKPLRFLDLGSVSVAFDGDLVREGAGFDYTVDYAAGTITATAGAAAMNGVTVSMRGNFRFPVFFVDDHLEIGVHTRAGEIPSIQIEEAPY